MTAPPLTIPESRRAVLHGYFTTALEGGIGYWSACKKYQWMLPKDQAETDQYGYRPPDLENFYAILAPTEDDCWGVWPDDEEKDKANLRLDAAAMERGAKLFMRYCNGEVDTHGQEVPEDLQRPISQDHYWRQWMAFDVSGGVSGDFDAGGADAIVQFALFGEMVFG